MYCAKDLNEDAQDVLVNVKDKIERVEAELHAAGGLRQYGVVKSHVTDIAFSLRIAARELREFAALLPIKPDTAELAAQSRRAVEQSRHNW